MRAIETTQLGGLPSPQGQNMSVNVRLLGPVEVICGELPVGLGGPKPRALLAMLALDTGSTVSTDRLIDGLWGDEPPATAAKLVQVYVSHLRKALVGAGADGVIATHGHGYELAVDRSQVDATRFERLLAQGAARQALELWRGSPLANVALEPFAGPEIRRLTELRAAALEVAIDQDLEAGRHRDVLPELESLLGQEPLRERLHAQRILALYRSGRQADALEAYRHARDLLINEVGVEPGPDLRRLHDALLRQDPSLDAPNAVPTPAPAQIAVTPQPDVVESIDELAARAGKERAEWQIAEDDLAAGVVALEDRRRRNEQAVVTDPTACPYKGLTSFGQGDAELFFGRERLVAEIVARLPGSRLLGVVGASGSGKSSVLRAGVLPALSAGVLPGSDAWTSTVVRPGSHPLGVLDAAMDQLPGNGTSILVVDQFEEAFTACADEAERARFLDALVDCARDHRRRTVVVLALRADFYGHCAGYPELSRMLDANTVLVGPMRAEELRSAIEGPARSTGWPVEPALVEALVADVEGEPGALPMLSTALLELWHYALAWQGEVRGLRLTDYEQTGGVRGAVARLAEAAYTSLDEGQQERARRILLRLAGDGDVRLRVPLTELDSADDVLTVLATERLVTLGDGTVEVAHEALLREWPRLVGWLEEDAEGRRLHRHLAVAARDWDATGRDASDLYRGARLAAAVEWATEHQDDLNDVERTFIRLGRVVDQAEAVAQRRTNRRLRALLSGVAGLLVFAVAAGAIALWQRGRAEDVAVIADARRLGAEALNQEQLDRAVLLASAGIELHPSPETHSSLLSVLLRQPAMVGELRGEGWPLTWAAVSDDGTMMATTDERGTVRVFDVQTRKLLSDPYRVIGGFVQHVVFSPDGRTVAVTINAVGTLVDLVDPRTGTRQERFQVPVYYPPPGGPPLEGFANMTTAFHPNGRDLIVQQSDGVFFDQPDGELPRGGPPLLTRLDGESGEVLESRHIGRSNALFFSVTADRQQIFITTPGDDATYEVDPDTLRVRQTHPTGDDWGAVSPDGRLLALGSNDGAVRLVDLASGRTRRMAERHEDGSNMFLAFTPDGRTMLSTAGAGEVIVWDVASLRVRERIENEQASWGLFAAPDGRTFYTPSGDGRLVIWDLSGDGRLDQRFDAGPPLELVDRSPKGLAVSPDGRIVAVAQADGIDLLDTSTLQRKAHLRGSETAMGLAFSPDGQRLAAAGLGPNVTIWDVASAQRVRQIEGVAYTTASSLAFSLDGRHVVVANYPSEGDRFPGGVRTYDVVTGEEEPLRFPIVTASIALSPDGRLVAAAGLEGPTQVLNLKTGDVVATLDTGDSSRSVAFSPDGKLLALGHFGGGAVLLSTDTYEQVGQRMAAQVGRVTAIQFSPDGSRILTGSADGTVQLWDVASQQVIGSPLTVQRDAYVAASFTPDGDHVIAVPDAGRGVRWDVREEAWRHQACVRAGRGFSVEEWQHELPGRPYVQVCGGD